MRKVYTCICLGGDMNHKLSIKIHCAARIRERLNRVPVSRDIDKMRIALLTGNADCFLRREYPESIVGVCRYQNMWTTAVFDRELGMIKTVGVDLS